MTYFKATIDVLIDVADETEASDAISESMRPLLREFAGPESCVIDWRYNSSNVLPVWDTGEGFEYADPEQVKLNYMLPPINVLTEAGLKSMPKTSGITAYWVGESQADLDEWRTAVAAGKTEVGFQQWLAAQPPKITLDVKLKAAERTLNWLAEYFGDIAKEAPGEPIPYGDAAQVNFALETIREAIADNSRQKLTEIMQFAKLQNDKMNGTGTMGCGAVPPTGDDWNDLYSHIMR